MEFPWLDASENKRSAFVFYVCFSVRKMKDESSCTYPRTGSMIPWMICDRECMGGSSIPCACLANVMQFQSVMSDQEQSIQGKNAEETGLGLGL